MYSCTFLRLSYRDQRFFSTWLPVTPLEVSWLELKTVRFSGRPRGRKEGPKCCLFFILKQPHAPRRGTFSPNRLENLAITDVYSWQIILMMILDEKRAIVNSKASTTVPYHCNIWRCHIDMSNFGKSKHSGIQVFTYVELERIVKSVKSILFLHSLSIIILLRFLVPISCRNPSVCLQYWKWEFYLWDFSKIASWASMQEYRIIDVIKSLVHPEVGILDNPRVRRFWTYNRAHRCLLSTRYCPRELVFRALLEVKPRKWFDNEVHYNLCLSRSPPPLSSSLPYSLHLLSLLSSSPPRRPNLVLINFLSAT